MINNEKSEDILNRLKEKYEANVEIRDILATISPANDNKVRTAWKILNNARIMENINIETFKSIIVDDEGSYEHICELVRKVYGEDAEKIIRERPELTMNDIPNFDIFDDKIMSMIGYGGVHTFLTYYMESESIITQIANNPELIKYYKEFEKITEGFFPPSAIGLEERLITFDKHKKVIQELVDSGRQEDYKEELLLFLRDLEGVNILSSISNYENYRWVQLFTPENDFKVETLEQLKDYKKTRLEILKRYKSEINPKNIYHLKSILNFQYFGLMIDRPGEYNNYDPKKFLEDYLKFNQTGLTEDEVDLVEIYSIFQDIEDVNLLRTLDEMLSGRDDVITPVHMREINSKVAENYKKEYLDSLITVDKARQMAEDPKNKSYKYIYKPDGNIYFSDHIECIDGVKKYQEYTLDKKGVRTYQYKTKNGEIITKKQSGGRTTYEKGNMVITVQSGKLVFSQGIDKDKKELEEIIQNIDQIIAEAELIPQYNPEDFKLEEGDMEGFVLYGVHTSQICISMVRPGGTSDQLHRNKISDKLFGGHLDRIYVEKYLEGGISTRSFYYHSKNMYSGEIGMAFTQINPNALLGFNGRDAVTTHAIKQLYPSMSQIDISSILDHNDFDTDGEVATLRYEYDIGEISERNNRRKGSARLYSISR